MMRRKAEGIADSPSGLVRFGRRSRIRRLSSVVWLCLLGAVALFHGTARPVRADELPTRIPALPTVAIEIPTAPAGTPTVDTGMASATASATVATTPTVDGAAPTAATPTHTPAPVIVEVQASPTAYSPEPLLATSTTTASVTVTATAASSSTPTPSTTFTPALTSTPTPINWLDIAGDPIPGPAVVRLNVPYVHQVQDVDGADGNWACGPTSVVMVLAYYGRLEPWPTYVARTGGVPATASSADSTAGNTAPTVTATMPRRGIYSDSAPSGPDFAPYVTDVYTNNGHLYNATAADPQGKLVAGLYGTICPTGLASWSRIVAVLEWHGVSGRHISTNWDGVTGALRRGHPVLLGTNLTEQGHILVAIGYTTNGYLIVNDPYGNRFAPGYGATNGQNLFYFWKRIIISTAFEVVGTYPPPTATLAPLPSTVTPPALYVSPTVPVSLPVSGTGLPEAGPGIFNGRSRPERMDPAREASPRDDSSNSLYHRRC